MIEEYSEYIVDTKKDTINVKPYYKGKNSLYQFADEWGLNSYEFEILKRVVRCKHKYVSLQEGNISKTELKQIIDHFSKGPKILGYEGKADKVIYGCKNGTLDELVKIYNTI